MAKHSDNLCRRALRNGARECKGEDLLKECRNLSKELGIKDVKKGFYHKETIKKAIWEANEKEIK